MVFTAGFPALLVVRLLQGLLIPAIMTALMTCSAQTARQGEVQRAMAIYIAATIVGGFLGRACSGIIATLLGWRFSFAILGISLLACFFILGGLVAPAQLNLIRPRPRMILEALGERPLLRLLLGVFCLFLVFAAIMNFIPFRLTELSPLADEMRIGLIYSGYMAGLASSLGAASLARYVGGERRLLLIAWSVYGLSLSLLALPRVELLFAAMFIFCAAMFAIHATASGLANRNTKSGKGVVNGLYVSFYYAGGVVGSWLPGVAYHHGGWNLLLLSLGGVVAAGMIFMCRVEIPGN
jgi:YNFM family putative membrane transporter